MQFHNGQKVVCVDDYFDPDIAKLYLQLPSENVVYVIRGIHEGNHRDDGNPKRCTVLLLIGLNNPTPNIPGAKERGFNSIRFRPLDELKDLASQSRCIYDDGCVPV